MMKKILPRSVAALLLGLTGLAAQTATGFNIDSVPREFGYPRSGRYGIIARHRAYSILYFQKYQLVYWTAYALTKERLARTYTKVCELRNDPMTFAGFAEPADYKCSGYMPGFLMPVDFASSDSAARCEAFYMTNTVPQKRGFNKGLWAKMEAQERKWAEEGARLWVIAGPIVSDSTKTIGKNKMRIPTYLFNVVLIARGDELQEAAFLFPNIGSSNFRKPIEEFLVPVNRVERMTGLDFFPMLPDSLENALESRAARITF
jgi:endonuclease G